MADDMQSQMKFIVEQQAQFAADIGALKEMIEAHSRQLESHAGMLRQLIEVSMSLTHQMEELKESDKRLGSRIEQLAEAQHESDRRLDGLIDTVDKLVRRNGGGS
jgi:chromosome segregation ATPase